MLRLRALSENGCSRAVEAGAQDRTGDKDQAQEGQSCEELLGCDKRFINITGGMTSPLTPTNSFKLFRIRLIGFSERCPKKVITFLRGVIVSC